MSISDTVDYITLRDHLNNGSYPLSSQLAVLESFPDITPITQHLVEQGVGLLVPPGQALEE